MDTRYAVAYFTLLFACGSRVLTHFCCSFSRSQRAKMNNDRRKVPRCRSGTCVIERSMSRAYQSIKVGSSSRISSVLAEPPRARIAAGHERTRTFICARTQTATAGRDVFTNDDDQPDPTSVSQSTWNNAGVRR